MTSLSLIPSSDSFLRMRSLPVARVRKDNKRKGKPVPIGEFAKKLVKRRKRIQNRRKKLH